MEICGLHPTKADEQQQQLHYTSAAEARTDTVSERFGIYYIIPNKNGGVDYLY